MTATPIKPVAESVGLLIEQIDEFIGPNAWLSMDLWRHDDIDVTVYQLNKDRYALLNADDIDAKIRIYDLGTGTRVLTAKATTLLGALQLAATHLVFGGIDEFAADVSSLRLIEGGRWS